MKIFQIKSNSQSIIYILLGYINAALSVVLNLTLIKYLSTSQFGYISLGRTIFQSFEFSHIGIRYAFDRILPETIRDDKRIKIFKAGFLFNILSSLIFLIFWSVFYLKDIKMYAFFIFAGFLYSIIQLYRVYYRAFDDKKEFIKISSFSFILPISFQFIFYYIFGVYGIGMGLFTSYLLLYILYKNKIKSSNFSNRNIFSYIFYILDKGYILFFVALVTYFATQGDRILIEKFWGINKVGEYSIILIFPSLILIFSNSLIELIMNKIIKHKDIKYVFKKIVIIFLLVNLVAIIAYLIIPIFLSIVLPKYEYIETSIKNAIFLSSFMCIIPLLEYHLHSLDKRKFILYSQIIALIIYIYVLFSILLDVKPSNIDRIIFAKYLYFISYVFLLCFFVFRFKLVFVARRLLKIF